MLLSLASPVKSSDGAAQSQIHLMSPDTRSAVPPAIGRTTNAALPGAPVEYATRPPSGLMLTMRDATGPSGVSSSVSRFLTHALLEDSRSDENTRSLPSADVVGHSSDAAASVSERG